MSQLIQIRNVSDDILCHLKARAVQAGMSLSDYLLSDYLLTEIKEIAERPTLPEMREHLHQREPIPAQLDIACMAREERGL